MSGCLPLSSQGFAMRRLCRPCARWPLIKPLRLLVPNDRRMVPTQMRRRVGNARKAERAFTQLYLAQHVMAVHCHDGNCAARTGGADLIELATAAVAGLLQRAYATLLTAVCLHAVAVCSEVFYNRSDSFVLAHPLARAQIAICFLVEKNSGSETVW